MENELATSHSTITTLNEQITELKQTTEALNQQVEDLAKEVENKSKTIISLNQQITDLQANITNLETQLKTASTTITELKEAASKPIVTTEQKMFALFNYGGEVTRVDTQNTAHLTLASLASTDEITWILVAGKPLLFTCDYIWDLGYCDDISFATHINSTHAGTATSQLLLHQGATNYPVIYSEHTTSTQTHVFIPKKRNDDGTFSGHLFAARTGNYDDQTHDLAFTENYAFPDFL